MTVKKISAKLHLWLGLASGLVVFVLGLTGAIYTFETELRYAFYPERYYADSVSAKPLPLRVLKKKAQEAIGSELDLNFALYKPFTHETYRFRGSKFNAEGNTYNTRTLVYKTVYINPFTGGVQYIENTKWEFFQIVKVIHTELMLGETGHFIAAWGTVVFVVLLLTGLVLWWPRSKAASKQRFAIKWNARWRRVNYDVHNVGGFYTLLITLILGLTGVYFGFESVRKTLKWAVEGNTVSNAAPALSDTLSKSVPNALDYIEAKVASQPHNKGLYMVGLSDNKVAPVVFTIMHNSDNYLKRSQFFFDKYTGATLRSKPVDEWRNSEIFLNSMYDIHVGKVLGLWGQIFACLGSLASAALPVTGFYIWWGKKYKPKKR